MPKLKDSDGPRPWPTRFKYRPSSPEKNLDTYVPSQWRSKQSFHAYRSHVAQSLGRPALPEVRAMGRQENMRPTNDNDPSQVDEIWRAVLHD